ncbi:hypothetical protein GCM10023259_103230 [Thermocatellispora tengchongensis]
MADGVGLAVGGGVGVGADLLGVGVVVGGVAGADRVVSVGAVAAGGRGAGSGREKTTIAPTVVRARTATASATWTSRRRWDKEDPAEPGGTADSVGGAGSTAV